VGQLLAFDSDPTFELVEKSFIMMSDYIDKAGDQQFSRTPWATQKARHPFAGLLALPFLP